MRLSIEDDRAHLLASELARLTGEDLSRAVVRAIEERLARLRVAESREGLAGRLLALGEACGRLPVLDERSGDEILYDDEGLPRRREAS